MLLGGTTLWCTKPERAGVGSGAAGSHPCIVRVHHVHGHDLRRQHLPRAPGMGLRHDPSCHLLQDVVVAAAQAGSLS